MISCKPGKQWKDLEAPDYGRFTPELGDNLAICSQMSLGRGTRGLGPLVTVLLLLFRPPHFQVCLPACLQKKWAAQGKRGHVVPLPPQCWQFQL